MSYLSGRSSYSGLGSSYSSYRPSYDSYSSRSSYDSWRSSSYSSTTSSYKPKTYDFGSSSYSSKSYGSDLYSRKYDDYSWKAKDLLTDNPATKGLDVNVPESDKLKSEYLKGENITKDEVITADIEHKVSNTDKGDSDKTYSSKAQNNSVDEDATKDKTKDHGLNDLSSKGYSSYSREKYSSRYDSTKYSSKKNSSDEVSKKETTRTDVSSGLSSRENLRNKYTNGDGYKDYLSKKSSREELTRKEDLNGDIVIRGSGKKSTFSDDEVNRHGEVDINMNVIKSEKEQSNEKLNGKTSGKSHKKRFFNFEADDDDVFVKQENVTTLNSEKENIFDENIQLSTAPQKKEDVNHLRRETPNSGHKYSTFRTRETSDQSSKRYSDLVDKKTKPKESKSGRDSTDSAGPLRMHRQGVAKFISVVPDEKRYISAVNFLPDRIELRFCGAPPKEKKLRKCRSITDLYEITVRPQDEEDFKFAKHPWEEPIQCTKQDFSYSYDSEREILNFTKPRHEHTKEMYISQYTHRFNSDEPRSHIAGWKCDYEPNGIPHRKSRMCVLKSPVVGDSRRRIPRPKSAPPQLSRSEDDDVFHPSQKVTVVERGSYSLPRRANRLPIPQEFLYPENKDFVEPENYASLQSGGSFFHSSMDDSQAEEVSSVGYAPSDDTSDSSAFFFNDPRYYSQFEKQNRDPNNVSFSKPRLIRLSAEFPGIRNLEKMRRKRQSMGSASSGGSRSSVGALSPKNGEYGFFVALTSGDPRNPQVQRRHRYSYT